MSARDLGEAAIVNGGVFYFKQDSVHSVMVRESGRLLGERQRVALRGLGLNPRRGGVAELADAGDLIPDELSDRYRAYVCKDGRVRVYNKDSKKVTSYPRFLMEQALGRPLEKNEQIHHLDEDPLNNSFLIWL